MADRLARIFGTEEDKVNCPFYFKIGACRHGNRCSRMHVKPNFSQTLLIAHVFNPPNANRTHGPSGANDVATQEESDFYNDFNDDLLDELGKFGRVEELHVCSNLGDHMFGNVYVKYREEEEAERALAGLIGRHYAGQMLQVEYSPVTDFREARCRQFDEESCSRGGYCNFMHLKKVPQHLASYLRSATRGGGGRFGGGGGGRRDSFRGGYGGGRPGGRDTYGPPERRNAGGGYGRDRFRDDRDRPRHDDRGRGRAGRGGYEGRDEGGHEQRGAGGAADGGRSASEERRAQIAAWNAER